MKVMYLCNGEACDGICSEECKHTTDREFAINGSTLDKSLFRCVTDEGGNIIGFVEIEIPRKRHLDIDININHNDELVTFGRRIGWNACIDRITEDLEED